MKSKNKGHQSLKNIVVRSDASYVLVWMYPSNSICKIILFFLPDKLVNLFKCEKPKILKTP